MQTSQDNYLVFCYLFKTLASQPTFREGQETKDVSTEKVQSNSEQYFPEECDSQFWKQFSEQLVLTSQRYEKKNWSEAEEELLIELKENGLGWREISKHISDTNDQVCKRKYVRLKAERRKWPKETDKKIVKLFSSYQKDCQRQEKIAKQFNISDVKKVREIEKRYQRYLDPSISRESWSIQQDLKLLKAVKEMGHKWKAMAAIFKNRSELQLKNRYYGTVLPIKTKVLETLKLSQQKQ